MTDPPTEEELARWERRAPGWVVRCLKCGLTQPFGKYGIRLGAASVKKCTLGRCPRCKRICCHVVEKRKNKQA
ncbi:MAG: hypothetical protein BWX88_02531 [Planctomycetes bacterium ADurb.Bin126]|nr:MAG: hypothetical protein BWX88_02531 [Planctomycetes bacterium ADurb.Bin126]HOD81124.1 hypothetical protein [Phycisphaerae bacterium]HQL72647.1 hypothetical protein [Phycisphaerae bacterium]